MHVIYCGEDAVPLQKDTELYVKEPQDKPMQVKTIHSWYTYRSDTVLTCSLSAQDIWARKYHELWEKLEKNTKDIRIFMLYASSAGVRA